MLREALRTVRPAETRVIAAGGDGTIRATLPAIMGTDVPLAILPAGTFNALAGELGIPLGLDEAIAVAAAGRPRCIDLGLANGQPFSQMAGLGFDGAAVHRVLPAANKNILSPFALIRGAGLLATYSPSAVRVETECAQVEATAWAALVANASRYTYRLRLAPGALVDDGLLDVWLFESGSVVRTIGQVVALLRRRHTGYPGLRHVKARRIRFESIPAAWLHLDGDPAGHTPVEVAVAASALTVIVPR
jgi:YegS/Rv2252/BmrU family lipid kinase